jgi:uncharacterized protein (DUF952 family)
MPRVYHLVLRQVWEANPDQPYRPDSLACEGFIHCSFAGQTAWVAKRFYAEAEDLLLLHIDPRRVTSPLREEACETGEIFPHIYGPLNRDAVVKVEALVRGPEGHWQSSLSEAGTQCSTDPEDATDHKQLRNQI